MDRKVQYKGDVWVAKERGGFVAGGWIGDDFFETCTHPTRAAAEREAQAWMRRLAREARASRAD